MAWLDAGSNGEINRLSPRGQPVQMLDEATATTDVPVDANDAPPSLTTKTSTTAANGDTTLLRCDGASSCNLAVELYGTSGTLTATLDIYLWDGAEWVKVPSGIDLSSTQTAAGPAAREAHVVDVDGYFAIAVVVSAISGTGAKVSARALLTGRVRQVG